MFDLEELEKLKALGARRVHYADGAEVEFDSFGFGQGLMAGPAPEPPRARHLQVVEEEPPTPAQMPSRQELREQAAKLTPDSDGAPVVTP